MHSYDLPQIIITISKDNALHQKRAKLKINQNLRNNTHNSPNENN